MALFYNIIRLKNSGHTYFQRLLIFKNTSFPFFFQKKGSAIKHYLFPLFKESFDYLEKIFIDFSR